MEVIRRRPRSFALRHLRLGAPSAKAIAAAKWRLSGRIVSANGLVPFSVRECTDYNDRRVPGAPAEANATGRRFGFVTTLSLQNKDENF